MNANQLLALEAKIEKSYVVGIDLRELAFLCQSARNLKALVLDLRECVAKQTIRSEGTPILELLKDIPLIEGDL